MRKSLVVVLTLAMVATGCRVLLVPDPPGPRSTDGFVPTSYQRARQNSYLDYASTQFAPGSFTNLIANAEHARRTGTPFNTAGITMADFANSFSRFDNYVDTSDFDLTYLMNLWYGYRDLLPADVRAATEAHFKSFKYWFTDPQPAGVIDQRYYWSENHRLLFHADEYLAGQAFPNDVFSSDGHTGAWHHDRAHGLHRQVAHREGEVRLHRVALRRLLPEDVRRADHVVEWADDPVLAPAGVDGPRPPPVRHRAAHPEGQRRRDPRALVHEGQERRHRPGHLQPVEAAVRRHHPRVQLHRRPGRDADGPGAALPPAGGDPAGRAVEAHDGRPGAHGRRARRGRAGRPHPDRHRRSLVLRPAEVEFWWEKGAQTAWQTVPLTLDTLDAYGLWESDFFKDFKPIADLTGGDRRSRRTSRSRSRRCSASRCSPRSTPTPTAPTR